MKTLYLLRHAKAESGSKILTDPDRPLAPRGHEACAGMGAYMKAQDYRPDLALVSSSVRTKQTFELISKAAQIKPDYRFESALYLASAEDILHAIGGVHDSIPSLLLVGHNPGMHHIALLLSETRSNALRTSLELKFPTCALAVLCFAGSGWRDIARGKGRLVDFVTPEDI